MKIIKPLRFFQDNKYVCKWLFPVTGSEQFSSFYQFGRLVVENNYILCAKKIDHVRNKRN